MAGKRPTIAQRIRELREAHKLGRPWAGQHLDPQASGEAWKSWESGSSRPSPDHLLALANFFNVSADYLLGRTDDVWPTERSNDSRDELVDPSSAAAEAAARGGTRRASRQRTPKSRGSRKPRPES